eukprot:TRINITY_DN12296_c0_g1_i12.p1 TRINITY_DN12296_c0_g1~~TRINITY_DN12296_c0_g1_i12.p1  ORF type:complete len:245 (+),score=51.75 TRINITY_DN12296_c0_g1_i12:107-841(+)
MSRVYDTKTTSFNSEGLLPQVEYAFQSVGKATPTLGVLTKQGSSFHLNIGVILAAKKLMLSKLLAPDKWGDKLYKIDEHVVCSVCGMAADALVLIDVARKVAQHHSYTFGEPVPLERLVQEISTSLHYHTQYGSTRPFGASILFAGYDKVKGYQLQCTDPGGNYTAWKAHVLGANNANGTSFLKEEYKDDISLEEGLQLALKAMCKTLDSTHPKPEDCKRACECSCICGAEEGGRRGEDCDAYS